MATLKISDLSVGDWVYHDDIIFGREMAKIDRLNKNKNGETIGITVYRSDGTFGVVGYIWTSPTQGDLHPIPITPEILENNGFMRCSVEFNIYEYTTLLGKMLRTTQVHLDAPQCIRVFVHDTTIERGFYHREKISVSILKDKVYIHELQHALRLAGIDKEIVMLKK